MSRAITFLSDFGPGSDYVGICHAVIARAAPATRVIDLAHDVPRGDVRAGAHILARAIPYTEPGVHLAVVDPGVGTDRRAIAAGTESGRVFVAPDNGLIGTALAVEGGAQWVREIGESRYRLAEVSQTFHGRDVFAPVAAAIASDAALDEVGPEVDAGTLTELEARKPDRDPGSFETRVALVDPFGNLVLDARWQDLTGLGLADSQEIGRVQLDVDERETTQPAAIGPVPYGAVDAGELLVHPDSFGAIEIAVNGGSAADELEAQIGSSVAIEAMR